VTRKQRAFVNAYVAGGLTNAAGAYRTAYPTSKASPKQQATEANRLLSRPDISRLIEDCRAAAERETAKIQARYVVTKERISHALSLMAFSDPRDFYKWQDGGDVTLKPSADLTDEQAGAVQAVSSAVTKYGRSLKVELADRRGALMDLAKLHGHIVEKKDVRVIQSLEDLSEAELLALAGQVPAAVPDATTKH
jgi:hypothetical protein